MKKPIPGGNGFYVADSTNITFDGCVAENNAGHGFFVERSANVSGTNNVAKNNGGGTRIPGTPVFLSLEDIEAAKKILRTTPRTSWAERLQTIKSIADIGKDVVPYVPAIIAFVRSLL
jgi:parallel beta-helix repeat protein